MEILLLNSNQIVQKLIEITASKAGIKLTSVESLEAVGDLGRFNYIIVDDDCLEAGGSALSEFLASHRGCLIYSKGKPRADGFSEYVQKPFLPTVVLDIITGINDELDDDGDEKKEADKKDAGAADAGDVGGDGAADGAGDDDSSLRASEQSERSVAISDDDKPLESSEDSLETALDSSLDSLDSLGIDDAALTEIDSAEAKDSVESIETDKAEDSTESADELSDLDAFLKNDSGDLDELNLDDLDLGDLEGAAQEKTDEKTEEKTEKSAEASADENLASKEVDEIEDIAGLNLDDISLDDIALDSAEMAAETTNEASDAVKDEAADETAEAAESVDTEAADEKPSVLEKEAVDDIKNMLDELDNLESGDEAKTDENLDEVADLDSQKEVVDDLDLESLGDLDSINESDLAEALGEESAVESSAEEAETAEDSSLRGASTASNEAISDDAELTEATEDSSLRGASTASNEAISDDAEPTETAEDSSLRGASTASNEAISNDAEPAESMDDLGDLQDTLSDEISDEINDEPSEETNDETAETTKEILPESPTTESTKIAQKTDTDTLKKILAHTMSEGVKALSPDELKTLFSSVSVTINVEIKE